MHVHAFPSEHYESYILGGYVCFLDYTIYSQSVSIIICSQSKLMAINILLATIFSACTRSKRNQIRLRISWGQQPWMNAGGHWNIICNGGRGGLAYRTADKILVLIKHLALLGKFDTQLKDFKATFNDGWVQHFLLACYVVTSQVWGTAHDFRGPTSLMLLRVSTLALAICTKNGNYTIIIMCTYRAIDRGCPGMAEIGVG